MAEEDEKKQEESAPKSKKGLILALVGGIVVLVGGAVGGAVLAPRLAGTPTDAQAAQTGALEPPAPKVIVSASFDPIIVDLRGKRGELHHIKVGIAVELKDDVTVDDFQLVSPRGRAAAIGYLRTLSFKDATDPAQYDEIQKQIAERVIAAVGKDKLDRVLLVDFVAQ